MKRLRRFGSLVALVLVAGPLASCLPAPEGLVVLGAASTRLINEDLKAASEEPLIIVNAGSSALVQQLLDGSPADVFISADRKNMDDAVNAGMAHDPQVVALNTMVLAVPRDNPARISGVEDLGEAKVVLCDAQVPCGAVARQLIDANDLDFKPVSLEHNVADALGKVTSGEADAGFVYRTDAAAAGDAVQTIEIPQAEDYPNELVAAVTTNSRHPEEAAALVALLASSKQMWASHGFSPVQE